MVGALYFADHRMKTEDQAFRGFPAVWNGLVFVLMVFAPPEWVTLAVIGICAILTFAPVEFVHPVRVVALRPLTLAMTALWSVLAIIALAEHLNPALPVKVALWPRHALSGGDRRGAAGPAEHAAAAPGDR